VRHPQPMLPLSMVQHQLFGEKSREVQQVGAEMVFEESYQTLCRNSGGKLSLYLGPRCNGTEIQIKDEEPDVTPVGWCWQDGSYNFVLTVKKHQGLKRSEASMDSRLEPCSRNRRRPSNRRGIRAKGARRRFSSFRRADESNRPTKRLRQYRGHGPERENMHSVMPKKPH